MDVITLAINVTRRTCTEEVSKDIQNLNAGLLQSSSVVFVEGDFLKDLI